jgi:hypothetical protein
MSNDRTERTRQVTALAHQFVDLATEQQTHQVALEALISAYASIAVCHPCCARHAADTARRVADHIENSAAPARAVPVH